MKTRSSIAAILIVAFTIFTATIATAVTPRTPGLWREDVEQPPVKPLVPGEFHVFQEMAFTAVGDTQFLHSVYLGGYGENGGLNAIDEILVIDKDTRLIVARIGVPKVEEGEEIPFDFWASVDLHGEFVHAEQTRTFLIGANIGWGVYEIAPASANVYFGGFSHWSYGGHNRDFGNWPTSQSHPIEESSGSVGWVSLNYGADLGKGGTLATGKKATVAAVNIAFPMGGNYETEYIPFVVNVSKMPKDFKSGTLVVRLRRGGDGKAVALPVTLLLQPGISSVRGEFKVSNPVGSGFDKKPLRMFKAINLYADLSPGSTTNGVVANLALNEGALHIIEQSSGRMLYLQNGYGYNFGPPVLVGKKRPGYDILPTVLAK